MAEQDSGTTPTERLLFKLCQSTFLRFWSYSNVFRDQGQKGNGDGKELCDVLVVFGDSVILFSDKSCTFPDSGRADVDWGRWYRRAVAASQRQLAGAERWLRLFPQRVFSDRRCTVPLKVSLPAPERMRVHRICVALGAADRCRSYFNGGSGSLLLAQPIDFEKPDGIPPPFMIEMARPDSQIVHVVNEVTLPIMLTELNTVSDFIEYLEAKERLIRTGRPIVVKGEEDLVGLFLGAGSSLPEALGGADAGGIIVDEGIYADILTRKDYRGYTKENESSYLWDYLIDYHTHCVFTGALVDGSIMSVSGNEEILRLLASESRVRRRILSDAYLGLMESASRTEISSRAVILPGETLFVFQVHPKTDGNEPEYRRFRQEYLHQYCLLSAWRNRDKVRVVGIVTDGVHPTKDGHDIVLIEVETWTPEMVEMGAELQHDMANDIIKPLTARRLDTRFVKAWSSNGNS